MSRPMRNSASRRFVLTGAIALCVCLAVSAADERAEPPVEVYDWSVWVGSPSQETLNTSRIYRNAMPSVVGTSRPNSLP